MHNVKTFFVCFFVQLYIFFFFIFRPSFCPSPGQPPGSLIHVSRSARPPPENSRHLTHGKKTLKKDQRDIAAKIQSSVSYGKADIKARIAWERNDTLRRHLKTGEMRKQRVCNRQCSCRRWLLLLTLSLLMRSMTAVLKSMEIYQFAPVKNVPQPLCQRGAYIRLLYVVSSIEKTLPWEETFWSSGTGMQWAFPNHPASPFRAPCFEF